jgi:hypothetical protein
MPLFLQEGSKTFLSASNLPIKTNQPLQADMEQLEHYARYCQYPNIVTTCVIIIVSPAKMSS